MVQVGNAIADKIETDIPKYVKMTTEEQNEYVISHFDDMMIMLEKSDKDKDGKVILEAMRNDPTVRQAGIEWGRSICATLVKDMDSVSSSLPKADLEKYAKEADESKARGDKFVKLIDDFVKAHEKK